MTYHSSNDEREQSFLVKKSHANKVIHVYRQKKAIPLKGNYIILSYSSDEEVLYKNTLA